MSFASRSTVHDDDDLETPTATRRQIHPDTQLSATIIPLARVFDDRESRIVGQTLTPQMHSTMTKATMSADDRQR